MSNRTCSGSAGGALASKLSEAPKKPVLVLQYGGSNRWQGLHKLTEYVDVKENTIDR